MAIKPAYKTYIGVFTSFGCNIIAAAFTCIKYFDGGGFYCPKTTICNNNNYTRANVLLYQRTPKSFFIERSEQKHDFYIGTDKQNVFLSIFLHIFVYQGHMLWYETSNIISTFYVWQLDDNAMIHKQTQIKEFSR